MRLLALLPLLLVAVSAYPKNNNRIVGGTVTQINQYPDMASLLYSSSSSGHRQACGGTIINYRSILTAAHCTYGDANARWRSRVGSTFANSGGTIYSTNRIINHAGYSERTLDNDIAIIRISGTITFGGAIRQGSFAGANYHVADNQAVWAAGWGRTSSTGPASEQLLHVQLYTVNLGICRQRYAAIGMGLTDNMLCSGLLDIGGRDQCFGDSGGPLYHNGIVVGVCSFGPPSICADPRWPGVNTRVQRYANWITQNGSTRANITWLFNILVVAQFLLFLKNTVSSS